MAALGGSQRGPLGVTSESDGSLRFWDLEQRRVIKSLNAVGGVVADSLTLGLDDRMLIVRMGQRLQVGMMAKLLKWDIQHYGEGEKIRFFGELSFYVYWVQLLNTTERLIN